MTEQKITLSYLFSALALFLILYFYLNTELLTSIYTAGIVFVVPRLLRLLADKRKKENSI